MRYLVSIAMVTILVATTASGGQDEIESPYVWNPKTTSVTVFKNELGFFLGEAKVSLRDGWCMSGPLPPAVFGTLAVYSHVGGEIVDIIGVGPGEIVAFDGIDAPADTTAKRMRLAESKYLNLQLTYLYQGETRTAGGQLLSVGSEYVVLQANDSSFAVPLDGIKTIQILEAPLRIHVNTGSKETPRETTLGMAYLRKGITWIPEYTLVLLDDKTAELTLRGTLVNEAEDIFHCDVNFVVGVPHFLHTDYLAPVSIGQIVRTVGAAALPREVTSQMMNRAAFAADSRANQFTFVDQPVPDGGRDIAASTGNLPQWEGAGSSDFTLYTRSDLTLRRGEKSVVTLFLKKIKYTHVYRWTPPNDIEHFLVLHNDTDTAWTTGPCLITSDGNPLSEDLLRYVPEGGKGEVPVTTAINIANDMKESEVDRKLKAYQPSHNFFVDLVTLEGVLMLRNYSKEPVELVVDFPLKGKPLTASDEGRITLDTASLKLLEQTGRIMWRICLKPGESKEVTYTYERYVPSL